MFKFGAVYFMALGLHRVELTPAEFFGLSIFFCHGLEKEAQYVSYMCLHDQETNISRCQF